MSTVLLSRTRLADVLEKWKEDGWSVHAPKKSQNKLVFSRVNGLDEIDLDALLPEMPLKSLVFPQSEDISRFDISPPGNVRTLLPDERVLAFGVRSCDARGIKTLDQVFLGEPLDPHYAARRDKLALVGIACNSPGTYCRCTSTGGSPHGTDGLDLQLIDLGEDYLLKPITGRGNELLSSIAGITTPLKDEHENRAEELATAAENVMTVVDITDAAAMDAVFEDPLFKTMAESCIRCGTCSFVCPTCHCFDIQDVEYLRHGRRFRCWDSCMYPEYSLHGSGYNPRPTRWNRWRNRMSCKFWYITENWNVPGCVGCGRCVSACPVNIDIFECAREVSERV